MNAIALIGRLTRDPELRSTANGNPTTTLRLAVPRRGADAGAVFVDVVTYGAQAEAIASHLAKGRRVGVTGRLEYREWTDAEGTRHARHEVVAAQVQFLDGPRSSIDDPSWAEEG